MKQQCIKQYFRIYKDRSRRLECFQSTVEILREHYLHDYRVDFSKMKIEFPTHCLNFILAERESIIGRKIDFAYFDESEEFSGEIINEVFNSLLRTNL